MGTWGLAPEAADLGGLTEGDHLDADISTANGSDGSSTIAEAQSRGPHRRRNARPGGEATAPPVAPPPGPLPSYARRRKRDHPHCRRVTVRGDPCAHQPRAPEPFDGNLDGASRFCRQALVRGALALDPVVDGRRRFCGCRDRGEVVVIGEVEHCQVGLPLLQKFARLVDWWGLRGL